MNKEIEEYLKDEDDYIEDFGIKYKRIHINNGDLKTLLDYITNLQEENKKLKFYLSTSDKETQTYINKLERINNEQYKVIQENKAYINECVRLQTIIDKAIDYIEDNSIHFVTSEKVGNYFANCSSDELLDILKRKDK